METHTEPGQEHLYLRTYLLFSVLISLQGAPEILACPEERKFSSFFRQIWNEGEKPEAAQWNQTKHGAIFSDSKSAADWLALLKLGS